MATVFLLIIKQIKRLCILSTDSSFSCKSEIISCWSWSKVSLSILQLEQDHFHSCGQFVADFPKSIKSKPENTNAYYENVYI